MSQVNQTNKESPKQYSSIDEVFEIIKMPQFSLKVTSNNFYGKYGIDILNKEIKDKMLPSLDEMS